jgi:hypothetical protein
MILDYGVVDQLVRALPPTVRAQAAGVVHPDPWRTGAALVELVEGLNLDQPLVVVVDDAQWADDPSLQALTFGARRLRSVPVLVCVTCRTDGIGRLPPGLLRLAADSGGRIVLGPLDAAAVAELAQAAYGRPLPDLAAERLRAHTGGNPLHTVALLDDLPIDAVAGHGRCPRPGRTPSLSPRPWTPVPRRPGTWPGRWPFWASPPRCSWRRRSPGSGRPGPARRLPAAARGPAHPWPASAPVPHSPRSPPWRPSMTGGPRSIARGPGRLPSWAWTTERCRGAGPRAGLDGGRLVGAGALAAVAPVAGVDDRGPAVVASSASVGDRTRSPGASPARVAPVGQAGPRARAGWCAGGG